MAYFTNLTKPLIITCYDENLNIIGYIDEFKQFSWNYTYSGVGTWTLTVSNTSKNTLRVLRGTSSSPATKFIRVFNLPSRWTETRTKEPVTSGILTEIQHDYRASGDTFTAKGIELKGISKRRIISSEQSYSSDATTSIMRQILNNQILAPTDTNRQIPGGLLMMSTSTFTGEAPDTYSNVCDALTQLSEASEIGWTAEIVWHPEQNRYMIDWIIYDGYDLSGEGDKDPIILSFDTDNLDTAKYKLNMDNLQNLAYVGGKGEGASRKMATVYDTEELPTGLNRYETFVDARNEEEADLPGKGDEALAQYSSTDMITLTPSPSMLRAFGSRYFIGDHFIFAETGAKMRLTEGTVTFENNKVNCQLTFGYPSDDFKSTMRIMLRNYKNMLNT